MITTKFVNGTEIPSEARALTRGTIGSMQGLYDRERRHLVATLIYDGSQLIGWCCARKVRKFFFLFFETYTDEVEIHTFIHSDHRQKGLGKRILKETLSKIHAMNPKVCVRYGAPQEDADFFNKTYKENIKASGLEADRYFCA
jgi:L-amino acid N-acyltransferase YncA